MTTLHWIILGFVAWSIAGVMVFALLRAAQRGDRDAARQELRARQDLAARLRMDGWEVPAHEQVGLTGRLLLDTPLNRARMVFLEPVAVERMAARLYAEEDERRLRQQVRSRREFA